MHGLRLIINNRLKTYKQHRKAAFIFCKKSFSCKAAEDCKTTEEKGNILVFIASLSCTTFSYMRHNEDTHEDLDAYYKCISFCLCDRVKVSLMVPRGAAFGCLSQ